MSTDQFESAYDLLKVLSESGVNDLSDAEIDEYIQYLCVAGTPYKPNGDTKVLVGNAALVNERERRFMQRLENKNEKTQFWFKFLAIGSLIVGITSVAWQIGMDTHIICKFIEPTQVQSSGDVLQEQAESSIISPSTQPDK